ncbi:MAG: Npt1/Npt2 family nucleotide transporter [bacterium]
MFFLFNKIKEKFNNFKNNQAPYDFKKSLLLGGAFFFIIATYSVIRPLKTSVFLGMVGKEYQPLTKILTILILFPVLFLYSKLVDKLRRYQVIYYFLGFYFVAVIIAAIVLMHPAIGLPNTNTSPYRIFGWIFYLLIDLYSLLVVSTFWAFANSISTPEYAKSNYGKIVAFSRVGGIITPILSWIVIEKLTVSHIKSIPFLLIAAALLLIFAYLCVAKIIKVIPGYLLHGYEAVYKTEKQKKDIPEKKVGILDGLKLILTQPYVLGIFGLVYIYEAISVILDYQMQVQMSVATNNSVGSMSSFMFLYTASFQILGLIFSFFGTSIMLKSIGVRLCLFVMPIASILMMFGLLGWPSLSTIFIIMVLLRALHYGFNAPVREILYIPTTKDIKFKSKAWIESFGRALSKTSGSAFNFTYRGMAYLALTRLNVIAIIGLSSIWTVITYLVGKKYNKTINDNQVIGEE